MTKRELLLEACKGALTGNLALVPGERVLIITDESKRLIGELFQDAAGGLTERVDLLEIPVPSFNGEEPPDFAAGKMKQVDVILIPLSKSLSWTKARFLATEKGARIASMPGITEEVILRTFGADYGSIRKRVNSLCDRLDETDEIHVTTELGTDLLMEVKGRKGRGRRGGIYDENGAWGNLPCGEAFIAPVEGTCRGTYVVDAAQAGLANLSTPITVVVEQGRSVDFKGGEEAELLAELLRHIGNDEAFNIAELGIGCNDRAAISSVTLEAEKALGTCHIGIGSNCHFGGKVDVTVHLDGVIRTPTIYFDGEKILDGGSLTINT